MLRVAAHQRPFGFSIFIGQNGSLEFVVVDTDAVEVFCVGPLARRRWLKDGRQGDQWLDEHETRLSFRFIQSTCGGQGVD